MAKVIKNFKLEKRYVEEFPCVKILESEDVYADIPICLVDFNREYKKPVAYMTENSNIPTIVEEEELMKLIKGTKLFHFKMDEKGTLEEVEKEKSDFSYRLPIDTPVEKLAIIEGQIGILEDAPEDTPEEKLEDQIVPSKENKDKGEQ